MGGELTRDWVAPATASLPPTSVSDEALAGETAAAVEVAVSVAVAGSNSVTVCEPAVFSVTLNVCDPASAAVKV